MQVPAHWTWETLKDFVKSVTERVKADVAPHHSVPSSHQVGFITVNGREGAEKLYGEIFRCYENVNSPHTKVTLFDLGFLENCYLEGRRALVYCFDITIEGQADLIASNSVHFGLDHLHHPAALDIYLRDTFALRTPPLPAAVPPCLPIESLPLQGYIDVPSDSYQSVSPVHIPDQSMNGYGQSPLQPAFDIGPPSGMLAPPAGSNGAPINTKHGYYETNPRGIHISQLSFFTSEKDLEEFVRKAAPPIGITIKKNSNGKSKRSAQVLFASNKEARSAVEILDGQKFKDRKIRVKLDREAYVGVPLPSTHQASRTAIRSSSANMPIMVNGSNS